MTPQGRGFLLDFEGLYACAAGENGVPCGGNGLCRLGLCECFEGYWEDACVRVAGARPRSTPRVKHRSDCMNYHN